VVVYDLGGGTFDVSVVDMQGRAHDVVASRGLSRLGGDDFDDVLVGLALAHAGQSAERLGPRAAIELAQHCRELKEAINPNTRKIHVELGRVLTPGERKRLGIAEGHVEVVTVEAFEAACAPLLERTLELVQGTLGTSGMTNGSGADGDGTETEGAEADPTRDIAGLYVVGGASALPAVARGLRALYGRRVKRSPYPSGAIAIGLAIAADEQASFRLDQRFHHNLGVFREAQGGEEVGFDRIIGPDTLVPAPGGEPVCLKRVYRAKHNVGHFRFIECGWLDDSGHPSGDIKPFADVLFPFDPALRAQDDLSCVPVARNGSDGPEIEERYSISEYGAVELTILDRTSGYERNYRIAG
jgi:hypothetical protein